MPIVYATLETDHRTGPQCQGIWRLNALFCTHTLPPTNTSSCINAISSYLPVVPTPARAGLLKKEAVSYPSERSSTAAFLKRQFLASPMYRSGPKCNDRLALIFIHKRSLDSGPESYRRSSDDRYGCVHRPIHAFLMRSIFFLSRICLKKTRKNKIMFRDYRVHAPARRIRAAGH